MEWKGHIIVLGLMHRYVSRSDLRLDNMGLVRFSQLLPEVPHMLSGIAVFCCLLDEGIALRCEGPLGLLVVLLTASLSSLPFCVLPVQISVRYLS